MTNPKHLVVLVFVQIFLISCVSLPYEADKDYWPEDKEEEVEYSQPYMGDHKELVSISIEDLNTHLMQSSPIKIVELLKAADELQKFNLDIQINHNDAKVIEINGNKYYARAFGINIPNVKTIKVQSFIIPAQKGPDYIFIPSLTVYDSNFKEISEVPPNNNYSVNGGILEMNFDLPENAKYFAIHTKQDYVNSSPNSGIKGGISHSNDYKKADTSFMAYVVFGSVLGAFMEDSMANGGNLKLNDFNYAHGGIVTIYSND